GEQAEKRHGERDVHPRSACRVTVATGYRAHLYVEPINGVIRGLEAVLGCSREFRDAGASALAPGWPLRGVMSPGIDFVERRAQVGKIRLPELRQAAAGDQGTDVIAARRGYRLRQRGQYRQHDEERGRHKPRDASR